MLSSAIQSSFILKAQILPLISKIKMQEDEAVMPFSILIRVKLS